MALKECRKYINFQMTGVTFIRRNIRQKKAIGLLMVDGFDTTASIKKRASMHNPLEVSSANMHMTKKNQVASNMIKML